MDNIVESPTEKEKKDPSLWLVHTCAIVVQVVFGIGNCIGKEALKSMPPIIFAFYRELFAGIILAFVCLCFKTKFVQKEDVFRVLIVGLCIFGNQVFFIVGLSFAPAHIASIWQPSQPIFTVVLAILLKMEPKSWLKIVGILFASAGSAILAVFSSGSAGGNGVLIGSVFFFFNCLSNSLFILLSKPLVKKYPPLLITALSYCTCTIYVVIVGIAMYWSSLKLKIITLDKPSAWAIPTTGIWCLTYFVLIHSIATYFTMLWCNKYIESSAVSAYTTFQPVSSTIVACIFLHETLAWGDMGAFFIFAGLACVIYDGLHSKSAHSAKDTPLIEETPTETAIV